MHACSGEGSALLCIHYEVCCHYSITVLLLFLVEIFTLQPLFSDVTFNVDGALVHSHKLVLCTRSEVMATMFASRFKESQPNTVSIIIELITMNVYWLRTA